MIDKDLVSIIVPCFNQGKYLPDSLQSILSSAYKNWECIIINDGSPDDTEEIALDWCKKDNRFHYLKKENGGLAAARNYGIRRGRGKYILPLDADDKISSDYIGEGVKQFNHDPDTKMVYCEAFKFGIVNERWSIPNFTLQKLASENIIFCSSIFKKSDWELCGGYDTEMKYGWEDWEFNMNMLKGGGKVVKLPITGFYYRIREKSMARSMSQEHANFLYSHILKKYSDFICQQIGNPFIINKELQQYKETLQYIENKPVVRFYKAIKRFLSNMKPG